MRIKSGFNFNLVPSASSNTFIRYLTQYDTKFDASFLYKPSLYGRNQVMSGLVTEWTLGGRSRQVGYSLLDKA